ncbi:TetR/AcrR family transcriptional regulator [Pseudonocardia xinjiangensis]|uniref:TetR/AcrR family transcriptional regulator n=1 Tax=Pseudonocardia xinjiangensis TaxID=75289 RepID=UPI003D9264D9
MDGPVVSWGKQRAERADAARNRVRLLTAVRQMIEELGIDAVTMDALAERSGLGKGTVFRRFGSRAGIFRALLDDGERDLQEQVLSGPPPLGPGAEPLERLIAYGHARIRFLFDNHEVARAALDGRQTAAPGLQSPVSQTHIRMLLTHLSPAADIEVMAVQLTAALDGPLLLYVSIPHNTDARTIEKRLVRSWEELVRRIFRD